MTLRHLLVLSFLAMSIAGFGCSLEVEYEEETAVDTEAVFTGFRVPGLVLGLQHNENNGAPGTVMYSALIAEATHQRGGDLGAARHRGFEWWSLPDIGGDPAAIPLPPGVVVALKHNVNQASVNITSFGRNPVTGANFSGFTRQVGGDHGADSGQGYFWYESTGAGFTNWSSVDALLPKYTVVGLKHALNQPNKVLVWNGVTYDPAASPASPPGFRRVIGGDRREGSNVGYYWFEKMTGEEIVTSPSMRFRLPQNLRMAVGSDPSVVDRDGDCLVDAMEAELANRFRPHVTFDTAESARRSDEPVTVWRMYPTSAGSVHIRWVFLFAEDGGYGPESWCFDDHPGDNDAVDYDLSTSDGGMTWRLDKIDLSFKGLNWPANSRLEVHEKFHPKFYFSGSKHHEYFNRDNDEYESRYSEHGCEDDVNGAGTEVLVNPASFPGLSSNNVGEPNAHSDFIDFLPMYPGHRIWTDEGAAPDCFVLTNDIWANISCGTNVVKFDGSDPLMPPAFGLCGTPTTGTGFVWGGGSFAGTVNPSPGYSSNTTGSTNTITHTGTGYYRVDFTGLGLDYGGNVQVTAYGSGSERCKVDYWYPWNGTLSAHVACYDAWGTPVDTYFTASYIKRGGPSPTTPGGYLWADQPYASSYTPSPTYQWNSTGALNTITRSGTGSYTAWFPGVYVNGGTVEVSAYGWGNAHCKVAGWGGDAVSVRCFSANGAPVDTTFTLNFAEKSPHNTPSYAYAWADQPSATTSYTPSTYYQKNFRSCAFGPNITMQRTSTGRYTATIPGLNGTGSTVNVSAYGSSADSCKVVSWGGPPGSTNVNVACFNASGQPVDSYFVIVYSSLDNTVC